MSENSDELIDLISPTFCAAKWLQITVDLVSGTAHSCHHTKKEKVEIESVKKNISSLHNTENKLLSRLLMKKGHRPSECEYCWKIEDTGRRSDRYVKSSDPWASKYISSIKNKNWDEYVHPTYLEVMVTDRCNFNCVYCTSEISSSITNEIQEYGPYNDPLVAFRSEITLDRLNKEKKEEFKVLFYKWLETVYPTLDYFRITGGEPLLSSNLYEILNIISKMDSKNKTIAINSNFDVGSKVFNKFINNITKFANNNLRSNLELYLSIDSYGNDAELIRSGLNCQRFFDNISEFVLKFPETKIIIMATFSILSFNGFEKLIVKIIELKKEYKNIWLDTSILLSPIYLRVSLATDEHKIKMLKCLDLMKSSKEFSKYEIEKVNRVLGEINHKQDNVRQLRLTLVEYLREYSVRNSLLIDGEFPEIMSWNEETSK